MAAFNSMVAPGSGSMIQAAMAQRGITPSGSPLSQVSPGTPSFTPGMAPPPPVQPSAGGPMMAPPPQPQPQMQPPQQPPQQGGQNPPALHLFESPQEKIIVGALVKQLERLDQTKKMTMAQPPPMNPQAPPVPQGMGGGY